MSQDNSRAAQAIIGAWRLVSFEVEREGETVVRPFGDDAQGSIICTDSGRFSAQVMRRGRHSPYMGVARARLRAGALSVQQRSLQQWPFLLQEEPTLIESTTVRIRRIHVSVVVQGSRPTATSGRGEVRTLSALPVGFERISPRKMSFPEGG